MTRTWIQHLRTIQQSRSQVIATTSGATPDVVTRTAATAINVSNAVGTPIKITTASAHGLFDGDMVTVASVGGNTNANVNSFVLVVDTLNFQMFDTSWNPIASNSAYTSGGTVTPWMFQDGDIVLNATVATDTNANGTFVTKSTSSTVQTLVNQYTLANQAGTAAGTGGTVSHTGSALSSIAGLDISGIAVAQGGTTSGEPSVRIRVKALSGGNASFTLEDSVNSFTDWRRVVSHEFFGGSGITKNSDVSYVFPYREIARAKFGVGSALLRVRADVDAGATCTYEVTLEY